MIQAFITAVGLVFIIEGVLYALAPGRLKQMMAFAERLPEDTLRTAGFIGIGIGLVIVWIARHVG